MSRRSSTRPPLWRDVRVLQWVFQLAVVGLLVLGVATLVDNVRENSARSNIPTGFGHLDDPAQFPIPDTNFRQTQPIRSALRIGVLNTVKVTVVGVVLATVLGTAVGVARLSGNWLVRNLARVYVEAIRNLPLLLIMVFAYLSIALTTLPRITDAWAPLGLAVLSNRGVVVPGWVGNSWLVALVALLAVVAMVVAARVERARADAAGRPPHGALVGLAAGAVVAVGGWLLLGLSFTAPDLDGARVSGGARLSPELFAVLLALVVYTASHIAEIVRGSILAVARGQREAADALGLSSWQRLRWVILPQAFRIALPPLGNQYLNLLKNSTLGAVISYYELAQITRISVGNGAPAVPSYLLTLLIFLAMSLVLSLLVNIANRRLALVTR